jgi:hypothetical protein
MSVANTLAYYDKTIIITFKHRPQEGENGENIKLVFKKLAINKHSSLLYAQSVLRDKVSNI